MKPLSRRELIRRFRSLGYDGPVSRGRHQYMETGAQKIHIPGAHRSDITVALQREILRQAGIPVERWEQA